MVPQCADEASAGKEAVRRAFHPYALAGALAVALIAAPPQEKIDAQPKVVTPGALPGQPPSDAIVLFDGKDVAQWVYKDGRAAAWPIVNGILTCKSGTGNIYTKQKFGSAQIHVEFATPDMPDAHGQARANSGVYLQGRYEIQILDSYNNPTYVNGQAGSIYKQGIPLVNPNRKPGEWQTYDVVWTAPTFNAEGSLKTPAYVTVFFNGLLVQNHFELKGETLYIGQPSYRKYDSAPIKLQAHGDRSEPISFRNIWVRELN